MNERFVAIIVGALIGLGLQQIFAWAKGGNCGT